MGNQHNAREAQDTRRAFLGAQNDAWFIILGDPPAQSNDRPRHDADRTAIAKVYDEDLCRQLVEAWNSRAETPQPAAKQAEPVARDGWKLVPVEPDETMEAVGDMNLSCGAADVYRAMLAARPSAPTAAEPVRERWLCLSCLSDRTGYHRTLDDKVTPCPQGAARASKGTPL